MQLIYIYVICKAKSLSCTYPKSGCTLGLIHTPHGVIVCSAPSTLGDSKQAQSPSDCGLTLSSLQNLILASYPEPMRPQAVARVRCHTGERALESEAPRK